MCCDKAGLFMRDRQEPLLAADVDIARSVFREKRGHSCAECRVDMRPPLDIGPNRGYNAMMELYNKLQGVSDSTRARFAGCMDPDSPLSQADISLKRQSRSAIY